MSIGDLTGIVVALATIYFLWQQNEIFKKQNPIFAAQSKRPKMSPECAVENPPVLDMPKRKTINHAAKESQRRVFG